MKLIKVISKSIEKQLSKLFNCCIKTGKYPKILKISRILPFLKKKNYLSIDGYRPIHILSPISKILEKLFSNQVSLHLKSQNMFVNNHQGGIKLRGTNLANIGINTKINFLLDKKRTVALVSLDQTKCYDIIPHNILLLKLQHLGLDMNAITIMKNYLNDRKQYVFINGNSSNILCSPDCSIIQGSIMASLFYTVYSADLPFITHEMTHQNHSEDSNCDRTNITCYIDDVYGVIHGDKDNIWKKISIFIKILEEYYINNYLKINAPKTQILITDHRNMTVNGSITIQDIIIKNSSEVKILGIIYSQYNNWNAYVKNGTNSLINQLKRRVSALRRISRYFNSVQLKK